MGRPHQIRSTLNSSKSTKTERIRQITSKMKEMLHLPKELENLQDFRSVHKLLS